MDKVTLKEFLNSRIDEVKESVHIAYQSMEKRLESMNEFRDTLKDQASRFVTREEVDAQIKIQQKDIASLQKIVWIGIGVTLTLQFILNYFR